MKGSSWESCGRDQHLVGGAPVAVASMKGSSWESCGELDGQVRPEAPLASMKGSSWESCGSTGCRQRPRSPRLNEGQLLGELRAPSGWNSSRTSVMPQ